MTHPRWKTKDEFPGSISIPFGIKTSHTWHEIGQILRIINDLDVQTFFEIGTHVGGLGSIVSRVSEFKNRFQYCGVEKDSGLIDEQMKDFIVIADALEKETAGQLYSAGIGKTMIYCDGGNKVKEMEMYERYTKSGDILACHDYFGGQEVVDLSGFGRDGGKCGCVPEVFEQDLCFIDMKKWRRLDDYLVDGTRITGFVRL